MVFYTGDRGSGKSSQLIRLSSEKYPIITATMFQREHIKMLGESLGLKKVNVYSANELLNRRMPIDIFEGLLIDEAEPIIDNALFHYLGFPVKAVSLDRNKIYILKGNTDGN